jgi:hypothetical protein
LLRKIVRTTVIDPIPTDDVENESGPKDETVKFLCQQSVQLQEYSRLLRERSHELNRRIQSYLNSKKNTSHKKTQGAQEILRLLPVCRPGK